jgi:hypothetical protein
MGILHTGFKGRVKHLRQVPATGQNRQGRLPISIEARMALPMSIIVNPEKERER